MHVGRHDGGGVGKQRSLEHLARVNQDGVECAAADFVVRDHAKRVRASLHASQAVFARYLNVSTKLVQAWEANRRTPDGPALVLLHIAARQPQLIERVRHDAPSDRPRPSRHRRDGLQAAG